MPPDDRQERTKSLLNQTAVEDVRREPRPTVPPAPADLDMTGIAFEGEVYRYAANWLKLHKSDAAKAMPFAVILSRSISQDEALLARAGDIEFKRYHAFHSQQMVDPQGCVIFATANLESALALRVVGAKNSQGLFDCIKDLGFTERHIAVFEPPHANLISLQLGLNGASRTTHVIESSASQPWQIREFEHEIAQFHSDFTRTPSGVLEPWSDASKGITGEKLEVRISKALAHQLDLKWNRGSVLAEVGSPSGRMDIFVSQHVLETGSGPCVIEVKVLRSHHRRTVKGKIRKISEEFTVWWGRKGVAQANLYRNDKAAASAYLCSFDARDKEADLPLVDALGKKLGVRHRKYFMHRNTGSLQAAVLTQGGI